MLPIRSSLSNALLYRVFKWKLYNRGRGNWGRCGCHGTHFFQKDPKKVNDYYISFGSGKYEQITGTPCYWNLFTTLIMEVGIYRCSNLTVQSEKVTKFHFSTHSAYARAGLEQVSLVPNTCIFFKISLLYYNFLKKKEIY